MYKSRVRPVRGANGMMACLPPLRTMVSVRLTAVHVHRFDVGTQRFADPQAVQREERDQRVVPLRAEPGLDQQAAEFVSVQPRVRDATSTLGRRTFAAGLRSRMPSTWQYR